MKKIVFVNQATGYLSIDIINEFAKHYDEVALIAGSIRVQDILLAPKVHWSQIALYDRGNRMRKLFSWLRGTWQIFWLLATRYRQYEIFYITVPPFAYLLSLMLPNRFSVLVFDVYPDILKINGIKESHPVYRIWAWLNRRIFKKAHRVFTIGQGMARLLEAYTDRSRLKVIPLWTGLTQIKPFEKKDNPWLKNLGLENKFIVQYSGNIGYTHNVEILVEVARELQGEKDIHFLIIGRGERFNHIRELIEQYGLTNCTLLSFQPDDVLIYSLAAADLGVVILNEKTAHVSLPSKIYNLQAVGVPLLCITALDSEMEKHVMAYENGRCLAPENVRGIIAFILEMHANPAKRLSMAANSRKASGGFTLRNAERYLQEYVS